MTTMTNIINDLKIKGIAWTEKVLQGTITLTKPGSITHLLYGAKPSAQSINIKLGRLGEFLSKELINASPNFELLACGIQTINEKNKDVDLIFKDELKRLIRFGFPNQYIARSLNRHYTFICEYIKKNN